MSFTTGSRPGVIPVPKLTKHADPSGANSTARMPSPMEKPTSSRHPNR